MKAGFEYAYTALEPLGNGASLPQTQDIDRRAKALGLATTLDGAAMEEASRYFEWLTIREGQPRGVVAKYDKALYEHQVPGGMISNLRSQLAAMRMEARLPEILEECAQVRQDLGYPILVSPFAQFIVTQAVLNVVQGERYRTIPDEVRKYACGYYGRLAAQPAAAFLERARIRPAEMVTERPADHVPAGLPKLRKRLGPGVSDEDLLLHAFYDEKLLAPLRDPTPECEASTTPLRELVKWLHDKRDIRAARIRFAGTEISFSA
jgi:pyruvate/oxaloacetate carboxyltransferase